VITVVRERGTTFSYQERELDKRRGRGHKERNNNNLDVWRMSGPNWAYPVKGLRQVFQTLQKKKKKKKNEKKKKRKKEKEIKLSLGIINCSDRSWERET